MFFIFHPYHVNTSALLDTNPLVLKPDKLSGFLSEVFWSINGILDHHQHVLAELFERQRDSELPHPQIYVRVLELMIFGSSIGMAKCLLIIHQTLHSCQSLPALQTKIQPTLPSLHPTMFPTTSHLQTQPCYLPLLTCHLSSLIEIGAYRGSFTGPSESHKVSADGGHLLKSL